jgi:hypothetical protein
VNRKRAPTRNLALALQGTQAATPPGRDATLALLAVPKIIFGYLRFRGG